MANMYHEDRDRGSSGSFQKLAFETLLTSSFRFWLKRNGQPIRGSIRFLFIVFCGCVLFIVNNLDNPK